MKYILDRLSCRLCWKRCLLWSIHSERRLVVFSLSLSLCLWNIILCFCNITPKICWLVWIAHHMLPSNLILFSAESVAQWHSSQTASCGNTALGEARNAHRKDVKADSSSAPLCFGFIALELMPFYHFSSRCRQNVSRLWTLGDNDAL